MTLAGWFAPRPLRAAWREQHERELWNWYAFFAERRMLTPGEEAEMVRYCWRALGSAAAERFHPARVVRSPEFVLLALAAALAALVPATGGLQASRRAWGPPPYPDPGRVVTVAQTGWFPGDHAPVSPSVFHSWRDSRSFEAMAPYLFREGGREALVGAGFFAMLRVNPALGRTFGEDPEGAVISHALWRTRFDADPSVLGRKIEVDGRMQPVIGVMPAGFWFIRPETEVWTPLRGLPGAFLIAGRLRAGVAARNAEGELRTLLFRQRLRGLHFIPHVLPLVESLRSAVTPYRTVFLMFVLPALAFALARGVFLRPGIRYELFFAAKTLLLFALLGCGLMEFAASLPRSPLGVPRGDGTALCVLAFVISGAAAMAWCARDQRRRCRQCLGPLTMPVTFGTRASWLLDPAGTQILCGRGHGTLYVPEARLSTQNPEGWTALDESWHGLFDAAGKKT
ncbi:MAG: ABC transporter permease [Bryobacteraceae bacterium]